MGCVSSFLRDFNYRNCETEPQVIIAGIDLAGKTLILSMSKE
jgi:hypothetical protein